MSRPVPKARSRSKASATRKTTARKAATRETAQTPRTERALKAVPAGAPDEIVLDVRGVSVAFGGVVAVDDVTLDVRRGSIVGLIGPNGAGKTTLFDAICGYVSPDRGRIVLEGRDITRMPPAERSRSGLGRSFQDAKLFPSLTVAETLSCAFEREIRGEDPFSSVLGMPWVWRKERELRGRVEELIDLLGLGAFRDKFISELSTGSRRIVDLACVLAHNPSVLLLDEPSSGIAQRETEALGPLLHRVKDATGCTMLLVEHDMPLVTSVSDEIVALETGRIIARGTPKEVTTAPRVVEAYLGTDDRIVARSGATDGDRKRKPARSKPASARRAKPATRSRTSKRTAKRTTSKSSGAKRRKAT